MAYKVFSNGNTLPASDLNTYLMNQSVISFASTSARDAAIPAPNEGMLVWLEDSDKFVKYTGSAWADLLEAIPSGNAIINGAFDIWQRGTSASSTVSGAYFYGADRWQIYSPASSTSTITQQTFTPGTAPVAGYEGTYFARFKCTNSFGTYFQTYLEDVRQFAGQTVTLSFWAKAASAISLGGNVGQVFGTGGSTTVDTGMGSVNLTTSWQRFSLNINIPSIAGKTIGTGSYLKLTFISTSYNVDIDIWGVQLEAGSTATSFKRNAPSIQAELAACKRYFQKSYNQATAPGTSSTFVSGRGFNNATIYADYAFHVLQQTMRTAPTVTLYSASTGTSGKIYDATAGLDLTASATQIGENSFGITGSIVANRDYVFQFTASAEL